MRTEMLTRRVAMALLLLVPGLGTHAQQPKGLETDEVLTLLTPVLLAELAPGYSGSYPGLRRSDSAIVITTVGASPRAAARFRRALLRSGAGKPYHSGDTYLVLLALDPPKIVADSATVDADHAARMCMDGTWGSAGITYVYDFARRAGRWQFVRATPYIAYDWPAPRPESERGKSCRPFTP